ncbi:MAG: LytTR family DNA-binding domain-containing protein [Bacteroidota bacterium]
MKCIIVEDQLPAQRILKKYIADTHLLNLVGVYTDALEAMQVLQSEEIDLIFLDIHLPKISGIDFLKSLQNPPEIILTTAFQEYALESYEYNVVDYLLKPFSFQRFLQAISKVDHRTKHKTAEIVNPTATTTEDIYIKSGYDHIRVKINDIFYLMTDADYTEIHLQDKKHLSSESLRYWEAFLPNKKFMRIHKSYIVNTHKISKVSGNQIFLENNAVVPIGRAYKSDFFEGFMK